MSHSIDTLKSLVRLLVLQEVRVLRAEEAGLSPFVVNELKQSITDTKHGIADLVQRVDSDRRNRLVREIMDQSVEEEIEEAIERRNDRCLRCVHLRFFDQDGKAHNRLPSETDDVDLTIGCEHPGPAGSACTGFGEKTEAASVADYITEVIFLHEVKEMFDRIDEIWDEYLNG
jgi:hypothetical protein